MAMFQTTLCIAVVFNCAGRAFSAQLLRSVDEPVLREQAEEVDEPVPAGTVRVAVDASGSAAAAPMSFVDVHKANASHACREGMFSCDGNRCMSRLNVCDGAFDCVDGTDEKLCSAHQVSAGRRGRLQSYQNEEPEPAINRRKAAEENLAPKLTPEEKAKILPYLTIRVPGFIPPPVDQYKEFYDLYNLDVVDQLPRLDDSKDYDIEVHYLAARIQNKLMASAGMQHSGIGLRIMKPADAQGHRAEAFRLDAQYWACEFSEIFGPHRNSEGALVLNDRNQMEWRNRAVVTSSKTHGRWHDDWAHSSVVKLGHITAKEYNMGLAATERWAQQNKYFQVYAYVKDGVEMVPGRNCEAFAAFLGKELLSMDLYNNPSTALVRQSFSITSFQTLNILKEPDKVNEPHSDKMTGYMSMFEPEFEAHVREHTLNYYQLRHWLRFQEGKTWTVPLFYGEDNKEFEATDYPVYYGSFVMDDITVEINGRTKFKKVMQRPHLPKLGEMIHNWTHMANKDLYKAGSAAGKAFDGALQSVGGDLPPAVVTPGAAAAAGAVAAVASSLQNMQGLLPSDIKLPMPDQAKAATHRTKPVVGNALTEDLGNLGKTAENILDAVKEHPFGVNQIQTAVKTKASEMLSEVKDSAEKIKKDIPDLNPEAVRLLEIGGEVAEKLNHKVAGISFADGVKALEEAMSREEHKPRNNLPKPVEKTKKPERKRWPLMR